MGSLLNGTGLSTFTITPAAMDFDELGATFGEELARPSIFVLPTFEEVYGFQDRENIRREITPL